jgi:hypothetical protein
MFVQTANKDLFMGGLKPDILQTDWRLSILTRNLFAAILCLVPASTVAQTDTGTAPDVASIHGLIEQYCKAVDEVDLKNKENAERPMSAMSSPPPDPGCAVHPENQRKPSAVPPKATRRSSCLNKAQFPCAGK